MFSVVEGPPAQLVTVVAEMAKVEEEHIVLKDGMVLDDVTLILFATGYLFSFPFFRETDEPFNRYPLTRKPTIPRNKETIGTSTYPAGGLAVHHLDRNNLFYCEESIHIKLKAALRRPIVVPAPSLAIVALHSNVCLGTDFTIGTNLASRWFHFNWPKLNVVLLPTHGVVTAL